MRRSYQKPRARSSSLTLASAANIFSLVQNSFGALGTGSKQENAYAYFKALWKEGILMGIQTPWEFLTNMAIENITAVQLEDSNFITDFSVTFKQVRIASTLTTAFSSATTGGVASPGGVVLDGAAAVQAAPQNPLGNVPGVSLPSSLLPGAQALMEGAKSFLKPAIANIFISMVP
jgi:hypothetical protein